MPMLKKGERPAFSRRRRWRFFHKQRWIRSLWIQRKRKAVIVDADLGKNSEWQGMGEGTMPSSPECQGLVFGLRYSKASNLKGEKKRKHGALSSLVNLPFSLLSPPPASSSEAFCFPRNQSKEIKSQNTSRQPPIWFCCPPLVSPCLQADSASASSKSCRGQFSVPFRISSRSNGKRKSNKELKWQRLIWS